MQVINETRLNNVLEYIKSFQTQEGRSPSYRQIGKQCGISSIANVQRYVNTLQKRGLIEKENSGKIITPYMLSAGPNILAPIIGNVACGTPIYAEENIEQTLRLPVTVFRTEKLYGLHAIGDSMIGVGIFDGDLILFTPCSIANNGDKVVALLGDCDTVKTYYKKGNKNILHPENPAYKDIVSNDFIIQGIVKHVIHNF